jgi:hypothetical protein
MCASSRINGCPGTPIDELYRTKLFSWKIS